MSKEAQVIRMCEAPFHVEGCNRRGETKDHFTPRCIAKLLGWTQEQMGHPMNIQYLSQACHREKDSTTPARLDLFRRQESGEIITIEIYLAAINKPQRHQREAA